MWDAEAIENHKQAARLITSIKDNFAGYIAGSPTCTEYEAMQFVLSEFDRHKLRTDEPPMVAFGEHSNLLHYQAPEKGSKWLEPETVVMLDLWAGLKQPNAPFADVTWMFYAGSRPDKKILDAFEAVVVARDAGLKFMRDCLSRKELPVGREIHEHVADTFAGLGYGKVRNNFTGHSIGFTSPHGKYGNLNQGSKQRLKQNLGYTLEPEIDYPEFGIRLEMNFYISEDYELVVTTSVQRELEMLIVL